MASNAATAGGWQVTAPNRLLSIAKDAGWTQPSQMINFVALNCTIPPESRTILQYIILMLPKLKLLAIVGFGCAIATALGQTWNETDHHLHGRHEHAKAYMNSWGAGTYSNLPASFQGRFNVSGSATNDPSWRLRFASICNNDSSLLVNATYSGTVPSGKFLVNWASFYVLGVHNNTQDGCPADGPTDDNNDPCDQVSCGRTYNVNSFVLSGTSETASRILHEKICDLLWFTIEDAIPTGSGGAGGGS